MTASDPAQTVRTLRLAHDAARWHVDGALSSMLARCAHALTQGGFELRRQSGPSCQEAPDGSSLTTVQTAAVVDAANGATYEMSGVLTTSITAGLIEHRLQTGVRSPGEWMSHLVVQRTYVDETRCEDREHEAIVALGAWLANEGLQTKLLAELLEDSVP